MLLGLHHIAIICSDYKTSKHFYTNILGLEVLNETYRHERDSYKLDLGLKGEYLVELFSFPSPPPRPSDPEARGLRHLSFKVADITKAVVDLREKGVICEEVRIDQLTGQRFTFLRDPDDLPIELYENQQLLMN